LGELHLIVGFSPPLGGLGGKRLEEEGGWGAKKHEQEPGNLG